LIEKEIIMKLKQALEIGKGCELTTIGEAIYNIRLHVSNLFVYGEEAREFKELCDDYKVYSDKYNWDLDTEISVALETIE
jgi:hypothetical protein